MKVGWKEENYEIQVYFLFILILVFISDYNDHEFDNLDGKLTSFIYSQADNSIFNHSLHNGPPSPSNESLALNNLNEILNGNFDSIETSSSEHFSVFDEPLFPDAELEEPLFPDPFEGIFFLWF